jgi:hypothetical protein
VVQTADFDVAAFDSASASAQDDKLLVKFEIRSRPDNEATMEAGRPIFKDVEYIDIKIPGSRTGGACRPASHADKQRFPRHYAAFQERTEMPTEGTPLAEWPLISRSQAEELAYHNVKTVENLVGMSDTNSNNFMGINALKAKAKRWLEQAAGEADTAHLQEELEKRDTLIEAMQEQLNKLTAAAAEVAPEPEPQPLASSLDEVATEAPVKKTRRRRTKVKTDGAIQDDK